MLSLRSSSWGAVGVEGGGGGGPVGVRGGLLAHLLVDSLEPRQIDG